ncbi:hypothetical protein BDL97_04G045800 [Sphagnum fallax]|nr:hypothetical protein BDL97_04G045800 [Sphagnum fallax]KAH8964099.1 hypothetical protein BDL97_04G045800 [Sphagnum fallax]
MAGLREQSSFPWLMRLGRTKHPSCYGMKPSEGHGVQARCSAVDREEGPDLSVTVNGLKLPNPFLIASGPPGTNYTVMKRAFDEGWGGVIAKTVSLDSEKVVNVTPRYAKLKAWAPAGTKSEVIGWENIELISDRPFETMLAELQQLKKEYPDRILVASIMEEHHRASWEEIIERVEATGVDALEINLGCAHGKMGAVMGQDCVLLEEVCGWVNAKASVPVWAKMTPNVTDITQPAQTALLAGCEGIAAINTIMGVMGINLDTLRPEPCVEGYSIPGGYSSKAIRPIALAKVMSIAQMMKAEFPGSDFSLSGIGGVETGNDAAEFILLGANTVQVCTGVMLHGYGHVKSLCKDLQAFMSKHGFTSIEDFQGTSLDYFTTHADLVKRQKEAVEKKQKVRKGLASDKDWTGEGLAKETETMVSN